MNISKTESTIRGAVSSFLYGHITAINVFDIINKQEDCCITPYETTSILRRYIGFWEDLHADVIDQWSEYELQDIINECADELYECAKPHYNNEEEEDEAEYCYRQEQEIAEAKYS